MKAYCMENDMLVAPTELEVIPNEPQCVWCGPVTLKKTWLSPFLLVKIKNPPHVTFLPRLDHRCV